MNEAFSLTKSNRVIIFLAAIIILLVQMINPEYAILSKGMSSEKLGEFVGSTIAVVLLMLVIPSILGWIVWRLRKRKENAGSTVLNVFLLLFLFFWVVGSFGKLNQDVQTAKSLHNMKEIQAEYTQRIEQAASPEEAARISKEFAEKYSTQLDSLKTSVSDEGEKRIMNYMQDVAVSSQASFSNWQSSFEATQADDIVNISVLAEKKEFEAQRAVINDYIEKTRKHAELISNFEANTIEKIKQSGASPTIVKSYIKSIQSQAAGDYKAMLPMLEKHVAYGQSMLIVVNYIEETQDNWEFAEGKLAFFEDELLTKFNNEILAQFGVAQNELNEAVVKYNGG